ncbi:TIGR01777 family oxidoreductase [Gephyromycinifex aptenodytis]|uniref:TIGR01777 family oxidoreductase n=1 Tax=Gephyromycinifex aptenodytis TaxID=2716227 RepID=UPI0014451963|nr:TIGR01777 family oxidoreductase [Gephyromycinifex aptenodytis]
MSRIALTGASGLIGTALSSALSARGDEVLHLVRRPARTAAEITWKPGSDLDPAALADVDAVVHLAGAGVGDKRWTPQYRKLIKSSRVEGTRTIAAALARLQRPVRLVSGSAVGFYGSDRAEEVLTEDSAAGSGFLAEVVQAWEAQTERATRAGHPVALARTGIVLSPQGGAMAKVLPLSKLGLGGPLGSGEQYWPWITLPDEVAALMHLIDNPSITGPVNLVAPAPERQRELMRLLGEALGRPAVLPAPAFALRAALGEFAEDILGSQRVTPPVLLASGFTFTHPDPQSAMRWLADAARATA